MAMTVIDPRKHVVKDTPVARQFRRLLKTDDIVTFFSLETGQWVLGYWANKLGKVVDEIEDSIEQVFVK